MLLVNSYYVIHSTSMFLSGSINDDANGTTVIIINNRGLLRMAKIKDATFHDFALLVLSVIFLLSIRKLSVFHSWFSSMITMITMIIMITIGHTDGLTNASCVFIGASTFFCNCT